ncbi:MAG: AMIN domain-containing protein [Burkholderiales bacterium]|nr:AMIN domain-containing protein [Burkholderiales bacterium]
MLLKFRRILLPCLLLVLLTRTLPAQANEVKALRHSSGPGKVRMVVDLSDPPIYQVYTLSSPERLVVELLDTEATALRPATPPTAGVIARWRVEQPTLRRFRWVVDLDAPLTSDRVKTMVLEDPHRLVVDLQTTWEEERSLPLTEGVTWFRREVVGGFRGYLLWNELAFDPQDPHLRLDLGLAKDRLDARETVTAMARRTGALAAINAGYFASSGGPLGVVVREGRILAPHVSRRPPRTVLGLTKKREVLFDRVAVRDKSLTSLSGQDWSEVEMACGGGPRLLHAGRVALTTNEEQLGPNGNNITRVAGRTAVAVTADGKMLLATASGYRDNHSQGMKLEELASTLLRRGAHEAMNMDGGGSVSMVLGGRKISDGVGCRLAERPVATAILLFDERPTLYPEQVVLELATTRLPADGRSTTQAVVHVRTASGAPVPDGTPVEFRAEGLAAPARASTRAGKVEVPLTTLCLPGKARLRISSGHAEASGEIVLQAGALQRLVTRVGPATPTPPTDSQPGLPEAESTPPAPTSRTQLLEVLAEDGWYNTLPGVPVVVSVDGAEVGTFPTPREGNLQLKLELPLQACQVTLQAGELDPVTVPIPTLSPPQP